MHDTVAFELAVADRDVDAGRDSLTYPERLTHAEQQRNSDSLERYSWRA